MAEFMLLMRNEGIPMANLSEEEQGAVMAEWGAWMGNLQEKGQLKGGLPFNPESAVVINNKGEVSKGYYTQGSGVNVGGFIHLDVANIDEAIAIAKTTPGLHTEASTIEVKEFMNMEAPAE